MNSVFFNDTPDTIERFLNQLFIQLSLGYTFNTVSLYEILNPHKYDVKDELLNYAKKKDEIVNYTAKKEEEGWDYTKESQENVDRLKPLLNILSVQPIEVESVKKLPAIKTIIEKNKIYDAALREGQVQLYRKIVEATGGTPLPLMPQYCRLMNRSGFTFVESIFLNAIFMPSRARALRTLNKPLKEKKDFKRAEKWFTKISNALFSKKTLSAIIYNWLYAFDDIAFDYYTELLERYSREFLFDPQRNTQKKFYRTRKIWLEEYEHELECQYGRICRELKNEHQTLEKAASVLFGTENDSFGCEQEQKMKEYIQSRSMEAALEAMRLPKKDRWKYPKLIASSSCNEDTKETKNLLSFEINQMEYVLGEVSYIAEMLAKSIMYDLIMGLNAKMFDNVSEMIITIQNNVKKVYATYQFEPIRGLLKDTSTAFLFSFTSKMIVYILLAIKEACNILTVLPESSVAKDDDMFDYLIRLHKNENTPKGIENTAQV